MTREEALKEKAYRYVQDVDGDWFKVYSEKNFTNVINKIYDELEELQEELRTKQTKQASTPSTMDFF